MRCFATCFEAVRHRLGRFGEAVDPILGDLEPVADRELLIEALTERPDVGDLDHRAAACGSTS